MEKSKMFLRLCRGSIVMLLLMLSATLYAQSNTTVTLQKSVLLDKIKGGWAGQTIGCGYGGPTEFCYRGIMIPDDVEIVYPEHHLKGFYDNLPSLFDDVYMDLTFVEVLTQEGIDAPAESFATAFAYAPYPLWHANQQGRYNVMHGLMPPESGHWKNNPHADCIDYQIESDFAGLMSPGMPNAASEISDRVGHIMNYGDGWYGGVFIGAMYTLAFVENDVETIVEKALTTIPEGTRFRERVGSILTWYREDPTDWKRAWRLYNERYSKDIGCPELILAPGNIDATMNSAYVAIGLLYGHGDFGKTMEISTRCGQDSDCNPSSAAGILATMLGYSNIPEQWMPNLREVEDRDFTYIKLSLNDTYSMVYDLALKMIEAHGGSVGEDDVTIAVQEPVAVRVEQGFTDIYPKLLTSGIQHLGTTEGGQNTFRFHGRGIVVYGNIDCADKTYEAQLEVTVDGQVDRVMTLCSDFNKRTADAIYWNYDMADGAHEVTFKVLNPNAQANIKANRVIYYVADDTPVVPTLQPIVFNSWGDGFNTGTSGDFDGDGIHDLFLCGGNMGGHVLKGTGEASAAAYQEVGNIGDIGNVDFLATAYPVDFDGDGILDIVAFDSEPSGHTADDGGPEGLFLGDGTGAFHIAPTAVYEADGTTLDEGFNWTWIKSGDVADFDNDGKLDLVVCSDKTNYNCLLLGMGRDTNGTILFKKKNYDNRRRYTIQNTSWDHCMGYVKAYDFNSDGYMDFMLTGTNKSNKTVIFFNRPSTPTAFIETDFPTHRNLPSFDFADVNNDGLPEIYFSGEYHEGWYNQIYSLVNDDSNNPAYRLFAGLPWQNNDRCMGFRSSAFIDWNGDGIIDIIETGRSDTEMPDGTTLDSRASKIRINYLDGLEWADPILTAGSNLNAAIIADVNNDGINDYLRNGENELAVDIEGLKYGTGSFFSATVNPSPSAYQPQPPVLNEPITTKDNVTLSWQLPAGAIGNETFEYIVFDNNGNVAAGTNVANFPTGERKTPTSGNACQARQVTLQLPEGEYTYGIQMVSGAYLGSSFATGTFTIGNGNTITTVSTDEKAATATYDLLGRPATPSRNDTTHPGSKTSKPHHIIVNTKGKKILE